MLFNFFQRKKIGVGKSDFVRFCFAKSKTRVRHAPRHQCSCVQNGLSRPVDGAWSILLRLDGYGGQEQKIKNITSSRPQGRTS
ncbi:MAG: hypothetical protein IJY46_08420, partial [Lentisphaeria bacterium]|nr:hypothetical protein [Lentisphaeria bacterium]